MVFIIMGDFFIIMNYSLIMRFQILFKPPVSVGFFLHSSFPRFQVGVEVQVLGVGEGQSRSM